MGLVNLMTSLVGWWLRYIVNGSFLKFPGYVKINNGGRGKSEWEGSLTGMGDGVEYRLRAPI